MPMTGSASASVTPSGTSSGPSALTVSSHRVAAVHRAGGGLAVRALRCVVVDTLLALHDPLVPRISASGGECAERVRQSVGRYGPDARRVAALIEPRRGASVDTLHPTAPPAPS